MMAFATNIGHAITGALGLGNSGRITTTNGTTSATPMPTHATLSPGGTGNMLGGIYAAPPPPVWAESDLKLSKLQQYVEMCDDTLEYVHLGRNMETKDPKISILKLASVGEFIKNVGLKYSDNSYYIIREKE